MAKLIRAQSKQLEDISYDGGDKFTWSQLQKVVGEYFTTLQVPNSHNILIIDKQDFKPINIVASNLACNFVYGDAILCTELEINLRTTLEI